MIKKLFFVFVLLYVSQQTFSQKIMHSVGATFALVTGDLFDDGAAENSDLLVTTLNYYPRYNFIEKENSSVSVGVPLGVGFGIVQNTFGDASGIAISYDVPAVVDYNFGCHSTKENTKNFGGYVGAGFGFFNVAISGDDYEDFKARTYGPIFRGGVRFGSQSESWNGHSITIGLSYKKGVEKAKLSTFGLAVMYDL